ncbi:MAG: hypothetical protein WB615_01440, partial [Candidatus Tumulicola sp.]
MAGSFLRFDGAFVAADSDDLRAARLGLAGADGNAATVALSSCAGTFSTGSAARRRRAGLVFFGSSTAIVRLGG